MQYIDLKTYLPGDILTKVDRVSMANGLEVRVPFLDHEFVEWAVRIPGELHLGATSGKRVLKNAVRPLLPDGLTDRPKMGFSVPLASWLRGPLKDKLESAMESERMYDCGLFDPAQTRKLLQQHQDRHRDNSDSLWSLLMFERFLERYSSASV